MRDPRAGPWPLLPSSFLLFLSFLQSICFSINMPGLLLPQSFSVRCSPSLACSSLRYGHGLFFLFFQASAHIALWTAFLITLTEIATALSVIFSLLCFSFLLNMECFLTLCSMCFCLPLSLESELHKGQVCLFQCCLPISWNSAWNVCVK